MSNNQDKRLGKMLYDDEKFIKIERYNEIILQRNQLQADLAMVIMQYNVLAERYKDLEHKYKNKI